MIVVPDLRMPGDADDTASFQRAFEKAIGRNLLDANDIERHQKIYAPAGLYNVSGEFGIDISGDFVAPITFCGDGEATQIRGVNNNAHDLLVIRNTGGGNLRNWTVRDMDIRWGSRAIAIQKAHYGTIQNVTMVQQWIAALDINTNGDAESIKIVQPRIYEQRGLSYRSVSGSVSIDGLDCGEMCGEFHIQGGSLELNYPKIFGTALNRIKADQFPARNPNAGPALFTLTGAGSLHIRGGDIVTTPACRTVVYTERGGDIVINADIKLAEGTDTLIASGFLASNIDSHFMRVNLSPLEIRANTHLFRAVQPAVRGHRKFVGMVRTRNGSTILQDAAAPVDLANIDIITA